MDIWFVWVMEEVKIVAGFGVESGDVKEFEEVDDELEVEMELEGVDEIIGSISVAV